MAIDPQQERQRLEALYSGMTEAELQKLAGDDESLTGEASGALHREFARRGLTMPDALTSPGSDEVEARELVTIRSFRDLPEAVLAKGMLDSAGIECFLADDNIVRMDWFYSNAIGGIKLQVSPENAESAVQILEQPIPEHFGVEGIGDYQQPHCPKCSSLDITFNNLKESVAYPSAALGLPMPIHEKAWKCMSCDHRWEESE